MKSVPTARKSKIPTALLLPIFTTTFATGCACALHDAAANSNIYQSSVLRIAAKTEIPTLDGSVYTAQRDETWYSAAEYERLEKLYIDELSREK